MMDKHTQINLSRYVLLNIALYKRDGMRLSEIRELLSNYTEYSVDKILSDISGDVFFIAEPGSFDPFYVTSPLLYNTISKDDIRDAKLNLLLNEKIFID